MKETWDDVVVEFVTLMLSLAVLSQSTVPVYPCAVDGGDLRPKWYVENVEKDHQCLNRALICICNHESKQRL